MRRHLDGVWLSILSLRATAGQSSVCPFQFSVTLIPREEFYHKDTKKNKQENETVLQNEAFDAVLDKRDVEVD